MKSLKLKSIVTIITILFAIANHVSAQDKIFKKNKRGAIEATILEVGIGEVKYKLYGEKNDDLVYVIEKSSIRKIEFESGKTKKFEIEQMDLEEYFAGQKRRNLKVSLLGPLMGTTKFTYEQVIKPGRSWEVKAAILGLGFESDSRGMYGSVAYKIFRKPTFVTPDLKRRNIMQGTYLKPELFFGGYKGSNLTETRRNFGGGGVLLNLGKQWVFGENIVFDISYGVGYGSGESYEGYLIYGELAMGAALNVGIAF